MEWNEDNGVHEPEQPVEETEELQAAPEPVVVPEPAAVEHEPEPAPVEPEPEPDLEPEPEPEQPSLLKKEISFRRKPKQPKPEPELDAEKTSLLKKEISFRRKPKEPKQPKAAKAPKEPKPKSAGLKKEISLPFGRKKKEPVDAVAEPQAKEPRKPRAKRQKASSAKRTKRLVGLKIGGSQLAAARIVNNGHPELVQVARERLDHGIVVGGELREPELLADALRAFFRKHKLPRQGVRLGIANNRHRRPHLRDRGHSGSEAARERDPLPRPGGAADPDRGGRARLPRSVRADDDDGQLVRKILLVVAYRELIDRYVAACRRRACAWPASTSRRSRCCARSAIRCRRTRRHRMPRSSSSRSATTARPSPSPTAVSVSSRACSTGVARRSTVAIARELDCAPSEAEPIKRELSLAAANVPEGLTQDQADRAREAVRRQLQTFARELVSSLQFYQNQPGSLGIGEIVITGGTAHLAGVADELQRLIGRARRRWAIPLLRVKLGKKLREADEQLGSLAVAIGLGIED
jgi:hypothetical protein